MCLFVRITLWQTVQENSESPVAGFSCLVIIWLTISSTSVANMEANEMTQLATVGYLRRHMRLHFKTILISPLLSVVGSTPPPP